MRRRAAFIHAVLLLVTVATVTAQNPEAPIDRPAVVRRHGVVVTQPQANRPLGLGNGAFTFSADVTGLQTFPEFHQPEVPLGTLARWGGGGVPDSPELKHWIPRVQALARVGLKLTKWDGTPARLTSLKEVRQELDLWRGELISRFDLEAAIVKVRTCIHPTRDILAVRIETPALGRGRVAMRLVFPGPASSGNIAEGSRPRVPATMLTRLGDAAARFEHRAGADGYAVSAAWSPGVTLGEEGAGVYVLTARRFTRWLEFVCAFSPRPESAPLPSFAEVEAAGAAHWERFWQTVGMVDLSALADPRWRELERRIVLVHYLAAIHCAGGLETPGPAGITPGEGRDRP